MNIYILYIFLRTRLKDMLSSQSSLFMMLHCKGVYIFLLSPPREPHLPASAVLRMLFSPSLPPLPYLPTAIFNKPEPAFVTKKIPQKKARKHVCGGISSLQPESAP